jgi:GT2 family glycosyltransferase
VAAARNWGLRFTAPSAWAVLFLDADDVLEPDALDILRARLEADPAAVGAHGQVRFISSQGDPIRHGEAEAWGRSRRALVDGQIVDWPAPLPTTLSVLVLLNRVRTPGCVLLRREAIESVGGFDTDHGLQVAADYDLWLRLACRGHFAYVDDVVLSYRLHEHSLSRNVRATNTVSRTVRKKLARSTLISREQRELATWGYRYSSLLRSSHWFRWAQDSIRRRRLGAAANQARHALVELLRFYLDRA